MIDDALEAPDMDRLALRRILLQPFRHHPITPGIDIDQAVEHIVMLHATLRHDHTIDAQTSLVAEAPGEGDPGGIRSQSTKPRRQT